MASEIKRTPMLMGSDAIYFNKQLAKSSKKKISTKDKERIKSLVEKVLNNSNPPIQF